MQGMAPEARIESDGTPAKASTAAGAT
jgi:hypothetical protein